MTEIIGVIEGDELRITMPRGGALEVTLRAGGATLLPTDDPACVVFMASRGCVMPHDGETCSRCDWLRPPL